MTALQSFPRITPFLWFDNNAEEAADFYISIFKNSRRLERLDSSTDTTVPRGKVLTVTFELDGLRFTALNGGAESQCGWLKDKFGLSWQVVPAQLPDLLKYPKAMQAMMTMKKLDIAQLEAAAKS
jgi:predicted 3-demethylubiquinone-9 3-methyltransferase (glyoxalase superfamily)